MQGQSISLQDCVRSCERTWIEDYEAEVQQGSIEAQIILANLLIRGAGNLPANLHSGINYLKSASRYSAEAALRLGKIYFKGKLVRQDFEEAYFYTRLATLFRCKCGRLREEYHSNRISHAHPCFPTEAQQFIVQIPADEESENRFRAKYQSWKRRRY